MDSTEMSDIVPESPPTTNESRPAGDEPKLSGIQFEWDPKGLVPDKGDFGQPLLFIAGNTKVVGATKRLKGLRWFNPATVRDNILHIHMDAQVQGKPYVLNRSDLLRPLIEIIDDFQDMVDEDNTAEDFTSRGEFGPANKRLKVWEDDVVEVRTGVEGGELNWETSGNPCQECEELKAQLQQEKDKVKVLEARLAAIVGGDNM
ncbi:hypothetical protein BGX38DRAFT_1329228 [Terfezia claveryi]|nr:hypothetical protein BGX38DRAFT_1329228 [Terfezia claveryi]